MEIHGEISMEFHGKCPNPPWRYFPSKSMEKFPWNSMEIDVLILHGVPWNSMEVFHTGFFNTRRVTRGEMCVLEGFRFF